MRGAKTPKVLVVAALLLVHGSAGVVAQPQVSLVWPDSSTAFTTGSYLKMKAAATTSTGSIVRVEFLGDTNLLGVATNPPFNFGEALGSEQLFFRSIHPCH